MSFAQTRFIGHRCKWTFTLKQGILAEYSKDLADPCVNISKVDTGISIAVSLYSPPCQNALISTCSNWQALIECWFSSLTIRQKPFVRPDSV